MEPMQGAPLGVEQVKANLASQFSRAQKYLNAQMGRFDKETLRRIENGEVKIFDKAIYHRAVVRGGQGNTSTHLLRPDNKRREGISRFNGISLQKSENMVIAAIGVRYGLYILEAPDVQYTNDDDIENAYAAQASYHSQAMFPNVDTLQFDRVYDPQSREFLNMVPNALRSATIYISIDGKVITSMMLDEFLIASWNAPGGLKVAAALPLECLQMLREEQPITIEIRHPISSRQLPTSIQYVSTDPNAPAGVVTRDIYHFIETTLYGPGTTPVI